MSRAATGRSTSEIARWAATTVVVCAVASAVMELLGMEPHLTLVVMVVVLVSAVTWLIADLATIAIPLSWYHHRGTPESSSRPDRRVQLLTTRLRQNTRSSNRRRVAGPTGPDEYQPVDEIAESLIAVLDDHLVAQHGINRSAHERAANETLGPELTRFVSDPEAARSMLQRRTLAHTVSLIEAFTSPTAPTPAASTTRPTSNPTDQH